MFLDKFFIREVKFISIKNKASVLFIALALFFMIGAVSAANETDVIAQDSDSDDAVAQDVVVKESAKSTVKTAIKSNDTNIVKGKDFSVQLTDSNSNPIKNQTIKFTINKEAYNVTTNSKGVAKLKINLNPGTYKVKYSFSGGGGYAKCSNSSDIFVISTSTSKINAPSYVAYVGIVNKYTITLAVGNLPLANRDVAFVLDGVTIHRKTNEKGEATIKIDKPAGTYKLKVSYDGEDKIKNSSATVKITVKKGSPTRIYKTTPIFFKNKKTGYFKIKVVDAHGRPVAKHKVIYKMKGKKHTRKTNADGMIKIKIKLKTGSYKLKIYSKKSSVYKKSSRFYTIKVTTNQLRNNGMWLFAGYMGTVNFKTLHNHGINQIFLNFYAFKLHSKSYVESWIKKAKSNGIKVHIWMQVFYGENSWSYPVKNGKYNYDLINSKVKEAVSYAKVKGVAGVHFDYVRYPGTAHKHPGAVNGVNLFVQKAASAVHKVNKKLIVSAAIMPEPSSNKMYYAQDIATIGKYLDVLVPMVYKGNYHRNADWIKSVTQAIAKQSPKAKVWTGLQSYGSDSNIVKLSAKELKSDAKAAAQGGACGIILFRYGLCNFVDFGVV